MSLFKKKFKKDKVQKNRYFLEIDLFEDCFGWEKLLAEHLFSTLLSACVLVCTLHFCTVHN